MGVKDILKAISPFDAHHGSSRDTPNVSACRIRAKEHPGPPSDAEVRETLEKVSPLDVPAMLDAPFWRERRLLDSKSLEVCHRILDSLRGICPALNITGSLFWLSRSKRVSRVTECLADDSDNCRTCRPAGGSVCPYGEWNIVEPWIRAENQIVEVKKYYRNMARGRKPDTSLIGEYGDDRFKKKKTEDEPDDSSSTIDEAALRDKVRHIQSVVNESDND